MNQYVVEKLVAAEQTLPITLPDPDTGEVLNVGIVAWTKSGNKPYVRFHSRKNEALGLTAIAKKDVAGKVFDIDGGDALPATDSYVVAVCREGSWKTIGVAAPNDLGTLDLQLLEPPPRASKKVSAMFLFVA